MHCHQLCQNKTQHKSLLNFLLLGLLSAPLYPDAQTLPPVTPPKENPLILGTAYHPVEVHYHDNLLPPDTLQAGGAVARGGDGYLGATGAGGVFRVRKAGEGVTP